MATELHLHSRRIRVFLSSTFQDMQQERDYLVKKTFPAIQKIAEARNVDFSVVDLRWGVTEEEAHQGKVLEICFNEVEETRPFFIGLIGSRYGWCPQESDIAQNKRLLNRYPQVEEYIAQGMSMTQMEMEFGAFAEQTPLYSNFFIRDNKHRTKEDEPEKLQKLRERIQAKAQEGLCRVGHFSSPKELGDQVYQSLMALMDSLYPASSSSVAEIFADKQQYKLETLQVIYHNSRACSKLDEVIDDMDFVESVEENDNGRWLVVVKGREGVGKSALAANFHKDDEHIVRTFLDEELNTSQEAFEHLETVIARRGLNREEVWWVIDGLEYLTDDNDRTLNWLLDKRVEPMQLLVTTRETRLLQAAQAMASLAHRTCQTMDVPTPFQNDVRQVTIEYLKHFAKGLSEAQLDEITRTPLFANMKLHKLFLQELVQFGSFEKLDEFMRTYLRAETAEQLITRVFERLEADYGVAHVTPFFGVLSLTNIGLTERQLQSFTGFNSLDWYGFYGAVSQLIMQREVYIGLMPIVQEVAAKRYLQNERQVRRWRKSLLRIYNRELRKMTAAAYRQDFIITAISTILFKTLLEGESVDWYCKVKAEVVCNEFALKKPSRVFRKHNIMAIFSFARYKRELLYALNNHMMGSAKKIIPLLPYYLAWMPAYWDLYLDGICITMLKNNQDEIAVLREHFRKKWLPPRLKRKLLSFIDNRYLVDSDTPIEDTWETEDVENLNTLRFLTFVNEQLPWIQSYDRIQHISDEVDKLIERIYANQRAKGENEYECIDLYSLYIIKSYCLCRNRNYLEAEKYCSRAMQLNPSPVSGGLIPFIVNLRLRNDARCEEIIKEAKYTITQCEDRAKQQDVKLLWCYFELLYRNYKRDYSRMLQAVREVCGLYPENATYQYNVRWNSATLLRIDEGYAAAANLYEKAAEVATTEDDRYYRLDDAAECYLKTALYANTRKVLEQLLTFYPKRNLPQHIPWAKGQIAETYAKEADATISRRDKRECYKLFVKWYKEAFAADSQDNGNNYYIRQSNYAWRLGGAQTKYHFWSTNDPLIQEAADLYETKFDLFFGIMEVQKYENCGWCMLAAHRYEWLRIHLLQLPKAQQQLYHYLTADEPERSKLSWDATLALLSEWAGVKYEANRQWNAKDAKRNLVYIYNKVWNPAMEEDLVSNLEDMCTKPEKKLGHPTAWASLLLYYYAMDDAFALQKYTQQAKTVLDSNEYTEQDKAPLRVMLQCLKAV